MSGNHNQSLIGSGNCRGCCSGQGSCNQVADVYGGYDDFNARGGSFEINDPTLFGLARTFTTFIKAYTPWEWHASIMERARALGLICFSSPFDETAVDFLEELGAPAYKIASFENNHLPLIAKAAATRKPLIISTGMATLAELEMAVVTAREAGCKELILLKCTSTYPSTPENTNISTIPHLRSLFNVEVGLSDHTMGVGVAVASVALGASVVEKHFTLARADGGVDSAFSLEPFEFKSLVIETQRAWESLGQVRYGPSKAESKSMVFRRSIYVASDIFEGEVFNDSNLRIVRPGDGAPPWLLQKLIGCKARRDYKAGTPLYLKDLF